MDINATIIVQAINFFIVYWMLRLFLFKPVVTIIEHEESQEKAILDSIDQQQKSLEIQEKERQRHWYTCQEYFNVHQPRVLKEMPCFDENMHINIPKTIDVSPNVIARIVADVRDVIEEKIKHVH